MKTYLLLCLFGIPITWLFLTLIAWGGEYFYLYMMGTTVALMMLFMQLIPSFIMPLFNKYEELGAGSLREQIEECARDLKFPLRKLYVVDASKRSDHSNAYYFGFGGNKRIVLFDTLLEQHKNEREIVAIVCHELGHWYYMHPLKMMCVSIVNLCVLFYTFSLVLNNMSLLVSFGFTQPSNFISFYIFLKVYGLLSYVLSRGMTQMSRKYEYEAD